MTNVSKTIKKIYDEAWAKEDACEHKWEYTMENGNCIDCIGSKIRCSFHMIPHVKCFKCSVNKAQWDWRKDIK